MLCPSIKAESMLRLVLQPNEEKCDLIRRDQDPGARHEKGQKKQHLNHLKHPPDPQIQKQRQERSQRLVFIHRFTNPSLQGQSAGAGGNYYMPEVSESARTPPG